MLHDHGVVLHWDGAGFHRVRDEEWAVYADVGGLAPGDGYIAARFGGASLRIEGLQLRPLAGGLAGEAVLVRAPDDVRFYRGNLVARWDGRAVTYREIPWDVLRSGLVPDSRSGVVRAAAGASDNWIAGGGYSGSELAVDDGATFVVVGTPGTQIIRAVWVSPSGAVWGAGDGGAIVRRDP
jgi:hypothetical protein